LTGLVDGSVELDQNIVDGARSSLAYRYARASETVMAAVGYHGMLGLTISGKHGIP
jgi:hypothetical protein